MNKFFASSLGRSVLMMIALNVIATPVLGLTGRTGWITGSWLSAGWFVVNSLLMWRLMVWVGSGQAPDPKRILGWCMIKFPVLYMAGLGILLIPGVSASGVLLTFTFFLISLGVVQVLNIGKKP